VVSLDIVFWILIALFALIGSMRGWAKEVLVTFAVLLSIFLTNVLEAFVPFIHQNLAIFAGDTLFWLRFSILVGLVFFGYQTPNIPRLAESNRFLKEKFQDILLGFVMGAINGYLVWGTIWYYLDQAGYPFGFIIPPIPGTDVGILTGEMMLYMPPAWLGNPMIYFAVAVSFIFVLVVFI